MENDKNTVLLFKFSSTRGFAASFGDLVFFITHPFIDCPFFSYYGYLWLSKNVHLLRCGPDPLFLIPNEFALVSHALIVLCNCMDNSTKSIAIDKMLISRVDGGFTRIIT